MKPFNLERAIAGDKLVTRSGLEVTEFHHFRTKTGHYPCVAVIGGDHYSFTADGCLYVGSESTEDLFMVSKKRTVHVQIFDKQTDTDEPAFKAIAFHDEIDALTNIKRTAWTVLKTIAVEIEE